MKIECKHFSFGHYKQPLSFCDVNFILRNKSKALLLSPKDGGKTSFLKAICGLEQMYFGDVFYDEKNLTDIGVKNINSSLLLNPPVFDECESVINEVFKVEVLRKEKELGRELKKKEVKTLKNAKINEISEKIAKFCPNINQNCKIKKLSLNEKLDIACVRSILKNPENVFVDDVDKYENRELVCKLVEDKTVLLSASKVVDFGIKFDKIFYLSLSKFYEYKSIDEMKKELVDLNACFMFDDLTKVQATITLDDAGYFITINGIKSKVADMYLKHFEKLGMSMYDECGVVLAGTFDVEKVQDAFDSGAVKIYDILTSEKIF